MVTERSLRASQVPSDMATKRTDMLSIHVPLTAAIKDLIGVETIARMKTGALIINAARDRGRGGIV
jgi:phosphoglycerate dehydrogenase-like enzyme